MSFGLGFWATAGGPGQFDYELIAVGSGTGSFTGVNFDNIPSIYKHLQVRFTIKTTNASVNDFLMRFNYDSAANYSWHELLGNGSSVTSGALFSGIGEMRLATAPRSSDSGFAAGVVDILDYGNTSKNKTIRTLSGNHGSDSRITLYSGNWRNTAAVTTINLFVGAGNAPTGSRFSLYGIRG
jgi:hypothetical protein